MLQHVGGSAILDVRKIFFDQIVVGFEMLLHLTRGHARFIGNLFQCPENPGRRKESSIILVVAAEMVVGKLGLGARLYLSGQVLETEQVFAILIVLATLGVIVTKVQDAIDDWLSFWRVN